MITARIKSLSNLYKQHLNQHDQSQTLTANTLHQCIPKGKEKKTRINKLTQKIKVNPSIKIQGIQIESIFTAAFHNLMFYQGAWNPAESWPF